MRLQADGNAAVLRRDTRETIIKDGFRRRHSRLWNRELRRHPFGEMHFAFTLNVWKEADQSVAPRRKVYGEMGRSVFLDARDPADWFARRRSRGVGTEVIGEILNRRVRRQLNDKHFQRAVMSLP